MGRPGYVEVDIMRLDGNAKCVPKDGQRIEPETLVAQTRLRTLSFQPVDPDKSKWRSKVYKYHFVEPPRQRDPVMRLLIKAIRELCEDQEHGILMCNTNIRVTPTTEHRPFWPPNRAGPNNFSKCYTFKQEWERYPATVEISVHIDQRNTPLTSDKLVAKVGSKWIPIKEWLFMLADPTILKQRSIMTVSSKWWQHNGRTFRLMDLPSEVRILIFEFALGGELYPLPTVWRDGYNSSVDLVTRQQAPVTMGIGLNENTLQVMLILAMPYDENANRLPTEFNVPEPQTALLRVSKQVQEGVLKAGWEGLRKCFLTYQIFTAAADSRRGLATRFNFLGKIRLNLAGVAWFRFFGVQTHPSFQQDVRRSQAHYLSNLSESTDLEIFFRSSREGYFYDAWNNTTRTSCQTTMVDWIMKLAFPHIKHIHNIKLIGYIKTPQKLHWQRNLLLAYKNMLVDYDETAEIDAIFQTPQHFLPPRCVCRKSCIVYESHSYLNLDPYNDERGDFDFEDDTPVSTPNQSGSEADANDEIPSEWQIWAATGVGVAN